MAHAKLTSKGQMTLPADIRADLGVGPGDRLRLTRQKDGRYVLEKETASLADLRGIVRYGVSLTDEELVEAIHQARLAIGGFGDRN